MKNEYCIVGGYNVYRLIKDDHWLLVSPTIKGDDRFMSINDMNFLFSMDKAKYLSKLDALTEINTQYKRTSSIWTYNGNEYKVEANANFVEKYHSFTYLTNYVFRYMIVSFRGRIYWANYYPGYYPQIQLYEFISIDKAPDKFCQWTSINNIKNIYKKDENNEWEIM